jgi:hypothetical protein
MRRACGNALACLLAEIIVEPNPSVDGRQFIILVRPLCSDFPSLKAILAGASNVSHTSLMQALSSYILLYPRTTKLARLLFSRRRRRNGTRVDLILASRDGIVLTDSYATCDI